MSGYLSAKDLLKYFNGHINEVPQRGGAKEYAPDGSWLQAKRVQLLNEERREVLSEALVKKKKHLIKGEWTPNLGKVQLEQLGKFWMTTGHVEDGRNLLYPEEALSLMEKGDLEIYYCGIPLSIQEAYTTLLGDRIPLEHHQVYNHLSRLGYIIFRHNPIDKLTSRVSISHTDKLTPYEVSLGLNKCTSGSKKRTLRKKKSKNASSSTEVPIKKMKIDSPACAMDTTDISSENKAKSGTSTTSEMVPQNGCQVSATDTSPRHQTEQMDCDIQNNKHDISVSLTNNDLCRSQEITESHNPASADLGAFRTSTIDEWRGGHNSAQKNVLPHSNFSEIWLPDICESETPQWTPPDPSLLPSGITLVKENYRIDFSHIRRTMSLKPPDSASHCDDYFGSRARAKDKATNWSEYKELLAGVALEDHDILTSPVGHLWKGEVQPLIKPIEAVCTASLLDRMKIIQNVNFADSVESYPGTEESTMEFVYDVYNPDACFSKSCPGLPIFRLCIMRHDDPCPELADLVHAAKGCSDGVHIQWAVVDNGDVTFYSFNGVDLPRDIAVH